MATKRKRIAAALKKHAKQPAKFSGVEQAITKSAREILVPLARLSKGIEALTAVLNGVLFAFGPESEVQDLAKKMLKDCVEADPAVKAARLDVTRAEKEVRDADGEELIAGNKENAAAATLAQAKAALAKGTGTQAAVDAADKAYGAAVIAHAATVLGQSASAESLRAAREALDKVLKKAREKCVKAMSGG